MDESVWQVATIGVGPTVGCAAIHDAILALTGKHYVTSKHYVEFGEARRQHDMRDMSKCIDWFRSHDPFNGNVPQVCSLASGLAASDAMHC